MTAALRKVTGVRSVERVADKMEMRVVRDGKHTRDTELTAAVTASGYTSKLVPTRIQRFTVGNLDCAGCETKAKTTLYAVNGTKIAAVSKARKEAVVQYDTRHTTGAKIVAALTRAGFPARAR